MARGNEPHHQERKKEEPSAFDVIIPSMNAEIIDFIDIWRAKRGLTREQAFEQMKIGPSAVRPTDVLNVVFVDDVILGHRDARPMWPHN